MSALFGHYLENICSQGTFLHVFEEERKHLFCFLQIRGSSVLRRGVSFKYLSISSMLADMGLSGCNTFVSDGGIYLLYYNSCEFDWSRYICTYWTSDIILSFVLLEIDQSESIPLNPYCLYLGSRSFVSQRTSSFMYFFTNLEFSYLYNTSIMEKTSCWSKCSVLIHMQCFWRTLVKIWIFDKETFFSLLSSRMPVIRHKIFLQSANRSGLNVELTYNSKWQG